MSKELLIHRRLNSVQMQLERIEEEYRIFKLELTPREYELIKTFNRYERTVERLKQRQKLYETRLKDFEKNL